MQGLQRMRELLQMVIARAVHAEPAEAQRIMAWVAAVRAQLDERDPIAAVLRLAVQPR